MSEKIVCMGGREHDLLTTEGADDDFQFGFHVKQSGGDGFLVSD